MKFSNPFKWRRFAAILGAVLVVIGLTAPAVQAAGSAGDGFTVSTEAGATPGTSIVTVYRTLFIPDEPQVPKAAELTLQLGGGATFSPAVSTSVTFKLSGSANTVAYTNTIKCGDGVPTLTVVGWYDVPVLCSGVTPPPDTSDPDGDDVLGAADKCPTVAAPGTVDGCPVIVIPPADADGDGVLGDADHCPDVAATTANGCPIADPTPVDDGDVKKVAFCHATGQDDKFVLIETSVNAFYQAGHDTHQDHRDIVPPFTTVKHGETINFPGLNWDAVGQAFFANGCAAVVVNPPVDNPVTPEEPATPVEPVNPVNPVVPVTPQVPVQPVVPVVPAAPTPAPQAVTPVEVDEEAPAALVEYGDDISQQSLGEPAPADNGWQALWHAILVLGLVLLFGAMTGLRPKVRGASV